MAFKSPSGGLQGTGGCLVRSDHGLHRDKWSIRHPEGVLDALAYLYQAEKKTEGRSVMKNYWFVPSLRTRRIKVNTGVWSGRTDICGSSDTDLNLQRFRKVEV